jgi:hypothetical protein
MVRLFVVFLIFRRFKMSTLQNSVSAAQSSSSLNVQVLDEHMASNAMVWDEDEDFVCYPDFTFSYAQFDEHAAWAAEIAAKKADIGWDFLHRQSS